MLKSSHGAPAVLKNYPYTSRKLAFCSGITGGAFWGTTPQQKPPPHASKPWEILRCLVAANTSVLFAVNLQDSKNIKTVEKGLMCLLPSLSQSFPSQSSWIRRRPKFDKTKDKSDFKNLDCVKSMNVYTFESFGKQ